MPSSANPHLLELERVLQRDAAEIVAARDKAILIHHSGDIRAAGDEVEQVVRRVIKSKLPELYYVGHGHIVDSNLHTSPQLDIIIADNKGAPILFRGENGTEYFPYESIYAIGEIKSSYNRSRGDIQSFSDTLIQIHSTLERDISMSVSRDGVLTICPQNARPDLIESGDYLNKLFSFMLFVESNDFDRSEIASFISSMPLYQIPDVICLLNSGLIVKAKVPIDSTNAQRIVFAHGTTRTGGEDEYQDRMVFVSFGGENLIGKNFGFLYFSLVTHLKSSRLIEPDLLMYMYRMFNDRAISVFT